MSTPGADRSGFSALSPKRGPWLEKFARRSAESTAPIVSAESAAPGADAAGVACVAGRDHEEGTRVLGEGVHRLGHRVGAIAALRRSEAHGDDLGLDVLGRPLHTGDDLRLGSETLVGENLADGERGAGRDALLLAVGRRTTATDGGRDMRAVAVPVGDLLAVDEALGLAHPVLEIGMGQVHARVEYGDLDTLAGQPGLPGRGGADLSVAALHRGVDAGVQPDLFDAARQTHTARSRAARPGGDVRCDRAPERPRLRRLQGRTAHARQPTDLAGSAGRRAPGVLRVRHDEREAVGRRVTEPLLEQSGDVEEFGVEDARLEVGPGLVGYDGDPAVGYLAANRSGRALGTLHGDRLPARAEVGHGHLVTGDQGDGSRGAGCVHG